MSTRLMQLLSISILGVLLEVQCIAQSTSEVQIDTYGSTGLTKSEFEYWRTRVDDVIGSESKQQELAKELELKFPELGAAPEAIRMLTSIAKGAMMGPQDGWFGAGKSLYNLEWLEKHFLTEGAKNISPKDLKGYERFFERLDRNNDRRLEDSDFDWSQNSDWVMRANVVNQVFRSMDREGNNRVSRRELLEFFDRLRAESDSFSAEDLRSFMLRGGSGYIEGDAPTPDRLLRGLFDNEIGSVHQGPAVGELAPDFRLKTHDGQSEISLKELLGSKPIVLVFGNFTCGPFRRNMPEVEDLKQRYQNDAIFVGIYVREAHPAEGWVMASNTNRGVLFNQPTTYDDRVKIAQTCHSTLNYTMPLLVDTIDDFVGNRYSGMPARLYVIDSKGKITYKGGRGPYGFKIGEMEQSLLMTLIAEKTR